MLHAHSASRTRAFTRSRAALTMLLGLTLSACASTPAVTMTIPDTTLGSTQATDPAAPEAAGAPAQAPAVPVAPATAPVAPADALTPEQFGAVGDGQTDDTAALTALFTQLNSPTSSGAPAVDFAPGRIYRFQRTTDNQFTVARRGATIHGNGATLKVLDGVPTDTQWFVLRIAGPNITVQDLTIDGNRSGRPPMVSDHTQTSWFIDGGSRAVSLRGIRSLNAPLDGMYIRDLLTPLPTRDAAQYPTDIRLEGVEMLNSGRNNLSIISSRRVSIVGGRFNGAHGVPGGPWAGIDIEPNGGADLAGNDGISIEGAETSDNGGSGIDVAQINNRNIVIRNHASHRNGTALFLSPSGSITVDGLRASGYGTLTKAGVIAIVPSDVPGAAVSLRDIEVSDASDTKPTFFQNYPGRVSLDGLRASNIASKTVLGTYQPTAVANVFVNGVKIQ